ncbi:cob(I)yrinic acid a,c-diamide adenosyltransferase [Agrobacterium larrymoorei]|uniref:cob(I)yrinic acid a,c-diamide adenosyltransferase n=1 Tax=Agrobacterium larrymoorei TaxID=160699 RepID=UPI001574D44C|nr:cob(I)yrinic acid a,c-diamide adenosyltransferase [Agrobacterium larrymoorei]NTJ43615.1 cob(I)yrinic acid a,c-diamide adenosyltransferase [Agrobacterium larrymoorei]
MVKLNKIYTRTGDDGTTALVSGPRRNKHDLRIESYGDIDETNSVIGIARLHTTELSELDAMLFRIQNDLFDLGADLATPDDGKPLSYEPLRIIGSQVTRLESEIDALNENLSPLKSFVLPGGSAAAAYLHLARTVARRAERRMVELAHMEGETVSEAALQYVNRLSDFLFVAARFANHAGQSGMSDVLWVPGQNR